MIPEEPEVAEEEKREKEDRKMLNKGRRLLSLISLVSPTTEKKEKELKTETPPYPTAPSVYLPSQESPIVSASTRSPNQLPNSLLALFDNNYYHDTSHSESSLPSHPVIKMGSLQALGMLIEASSNLRKGSWSSMVSGGITSMHTRPSKTGAR